MNMTSLVFEIDAKEAAAASFVGLVGELLQHSLMQRKELGKLTQQEIADRLGIDRSRVNRCFSGYANLSLEKLAELCWAMDIEPEINFRQLLANETNSQSNICQHELNMAPHFYAASSSGARSATSSSSTSTTAQKFIFSAR